MRSDALFLNGVFEEVLEAIRNVQETSPDQILYLQPYSTSPIIRLRDEPPTSDSPMKLFASVTNDLGRVHFVGQIVGWEDKRKMSEEHRAEVDRVIRKYQPSETNGLDLAPNKKGQVSLNLIHVRDLHRLDTPFSVTQLTKISDGESVSDQRSTAGGYAYVKAIPVS